MGYAPTQTGRAPQEGDLRPEIKGSQYYGIYQNGKWVTLSGKEYNDRLKAQNAGAVYSSQQAFNSTLDSGNADAILATMTGKKGAQNLLATLRRKEWMNSQDLMKPSSSFLKAKLAGSYVGNQAALAKQSFNQSFDRPQAGYQRNLASLGIQLTPEQQMARQNSQDQRRALGNVQASNQARRSATELQTQILGGGIASRPQVDRGAA